MNNNYQKVDCSKCKSENSEKLEDSVKYFLWGATKDEKLCSRCNGKGYVIQKADTIKL